MQTEPDTNLPAATLQRHADKIEEARGHLREAEAIIERLLGESEGRPALRQAAIDISKVIQGLGGVRHRLAALASAKTEADIKAKAEHIAETNH